MLEYKISHISKGNKRPCIKMNPQYITIHSTANPYSTAQNERDWLVNPKNDRQASWHICVDEKEAIEAIPLDEVAWHAGDGRGDGNMKSIAVEICESGNREVTVANAIKLVAAMLQKYNWGIDKLRRHYDWSKKNCPRIFAADNWIGWELFKWEVARELGNKVKISLHGKEMFIDGEIKNGVTMVPIRFIERLGYKVDWDDEEQKININYK